MLRPLKQVDRSLLNRSIKFGGNLQFTATLVPLNPTFKNGIRNVHFLLYVPIYTSYSYIFYIKIVDSILINIFALLKKFGEVVTSRYSVYFGIYPFVWYTVDDKLIDKHGLVVDKLLLFNFHCAVQYINPI